MTVSTHLRSVRSYRLHSEEVTLGSILVVLFISPGKLLRSDLIVLKCSCILDRVNHTVHNSESHLSDAVMNTAHL